jgi:hypothetical protein
MDAVFTVRRGPTNESLRYALRALATYVNVDEVWLVGGKVMWTKARNHRSIMIRQPGDRWRNTSYSLLAACESPDVSDPFMLWNDDFFALRPVEHLDWCHGTMSTYLNDQVSSTYRQGCRDTLQYLREHDGFVDPLSFDLHVPLVVHKDVMTQAITDTLTIHAAWKRSVYGNRALRAGLIPRPTARSDPKIYDLESLPDPDWDWLSTAPRAFTVGMAGRWVREQFPDPSPYEATSNAAHIT